MLNHAAVDRALACALTVLFLLAGFAAPSFAGGGIDLSNASDEASDDECPRLVRISHPFLCEDAPAVPNPNWENSRRMPVQGDWVESDGAWGPSQNMDWD